MADNIEYITFDNDELQTTLTTINGVQQPQQTAYINGTVAVDYSTNTVSTQGLTVTGPGFDTDDTGNVSLTNTNSTYQFAFGNVSASYSTDTPAPTQASNITYNSDPNQPDNVEYFSNPNSAPLTSSTTAPVTCFVTGTSIATAEGAIAVEHLAVGDEVLTASGESRRVRWIGHRTLDCRRHLRPHEVMPVRIAANAFGADLPSRDLLVSPGHAICVDAGGEVLIPVSALVNGTSIVQQAVESVTYWHVELDSHDVLLAEGLPCESYLDMGNRGFFAESGIVDLVAAPDAAVRTHADFCRPFHDGGAIVEAVRCRLAALTQTFHHAVEARVAA